MQWAFPVSRQKVLRMVKPGTVQLLPWLGPGLFLRVKPKGWFLLHGAVVLTFCPFLSGQSKEDDDPEGPAGQTRKAQ